MYKMTVTLAVDYDADRNGKVYRTHISPEIQVEACDNFKDLAKDKKVITALNWIKKSR